MRSTNGDWITPYHYNEGALHGFRCGLINGPIRTSVQAKRPRLTHLRIPKLLVRSQTTRSWPDSAITVQLIKRAGDWHEHGGDLDNRSTEQAGFNSMRRACANPRAQCENPLDAQYPLPNRTGQLFSGNAGQRDNLENDNDNRTTQPSAETKRFAGVTRS